ncbi:DUF5131 family protein [Pelobacter propionicus]
MISCCSSLSQDLSKVIPLGMFWTKRWHLVSGCTPVSAGCENCWMRREARLRCGHPYASIRALHEDLLTEAGQWNGTVRFNAQLLEVPLHSRVPQIFAIWSDLFHESVSDADIDRAMAVVLACRVFSNRPHRFVAPTKRSSRQRRYFSSRKPAELLQAWAKAGNEFIFCKAPEISFSEQVMGLCYGPADSMGRILKDHGEWGYIEKLFPLPNLIGCVTTENQQAVDKRIPDFLKTPFRTRLVLAEPLLGAISLLGSKDLVHGVLAGGESGNSARPSHPDWFRQLRDQCGHDDLPFFFKAWGEWLPHGQEVMNSLLLPNDLPAASWYRWQDGNRSIKVGKRGAGRLLDGQEHNDLPVVI